MKRVVLLFLSLCILFVSCKNEAISDIKHYGSLSLTSSMSRTIEPNPSDITCASYVVRGVHANGTDSFEQSFNSNSVTVGNLLVGDWTVFVEGYNSESIKIAESDHRTITILPSITTNASFTLEYCTSGSGTLNLVLKINSSDTTVAKVVFSIDEEQITVMKPASPTGSYYLYQAEKNLAVGQYNILVSLYDSNDNKMGVSLLEVARIYDSLISTKEWSFQGFASSPVFSPSSGTITLSDPITISSSTQDSTIYYTIDGSTPSRQSAIYSSPILLSKNTIVKATAVSSIMFPSLVTTAEYHIQAAAPTASIAAGTYESAQNLKLNTTTGGSTIYYTTDGNNPDSSSSIYNGQILITSNTTIKAIAINPDFDNSDISTFEYHIKAATPTSSVDSDSYEEPQSVSLSCSTPGSVIYYTIDGTIPTNESTLYSGVINVSESQTIKAIAYAENYDPSPVFSEEIVIATEKVGAVTFSVDSGTYNENQIITLSSAEGTTIFYTMDGSSPTRSSTQYSSAITVSRSSIIKAIAWKWGYLNSDTVTAEYNIRTKNPTMSLAPGRYQTPQSVVLSCDTIGASIYYTLDGSNPSTSSTLYTEAITINESTTIKAIAKYAEWDCSEVVTASYQIDGLAGFSIINPTHYSLVIAVPQEWEEGMPVIDGVAAAIRASVTPSNPAALYSWYVDGEAATSNNGSFISNTDELPLGSGGNNVFLPVGMHIITVQASIGNTTVSQDYYLSVSSNATIGERGTIYPYAVGDKGPTGGYIFYDCDEDNNSGNADGLISTECGWRYLEAAKYDVRIENDVAVLASGESFVYGYLFNDSNATHYSDESPYFVNGTRTFDANDCTGTAIGTGKMNTQMLVDYEGSFYTYSGGSSGTYRKIDNYAAKVCSMLEYTVSGEVYDDWFLPSIDELVALSLFRKNNGITDLNFGGTTYWSSSEDNSYYASGARVINIYSSQIDSYIRNATCMVRPIRSF